jgi:predicted membrane protein
MKNVIKTSLKRPPPKKRPTIPSNIISKTIGVVDPKRSRKAKGFCSCHCDFILFIAKNYIPIRIVETTYMVITTNIEMILQSGFHSRKMFYQEVFSRSCWKIQTRCMCYLSLQIVCLKF